MEKDRYFGFELLNMLKEHKLENNMEFKDLKEGNVFYYDDSNKDFYDKETDKVIWEDLYFVGDFMNLGFELIKDEQDDNLKEFTYEDVFPNNSDREIQEILVNKINQIIRFITTKYQKTVKTGENN